MIPVAGYADRLSVRPGETIHFKLANASGSAVHARLVRVVSADANPEGPGIVTEPVDDEVTRVSEPGPGGLEGARERVPRPPR